MRGSPPFATQIETMNIYDVMVDWLWILVTAVGLVINWRVFAESRDELHAMQLYGINGEDQDDAASAVWDDGAAALMQTLALIGGLLRVVLPPYPPGPLVNKMFVSTIIVVAFSIGLSYIAHRNLEKRRQHVRQVKARKRGELKTRQGEPGAECPPPGAINEP